MRLGSVLDLKAELIQEIQGDLHVKEARTYVGAFGYEGRERGLREAAVGFGVGRGPDPGTSGYALAVRVFDQSPVTLSMALRAAQRARGEADVQYVGRLSAGPAGPLGGPYRRERRPLAPGYSVSHYLGSAGTIGAFVIRDDDNLVCVLSNNHVLGHTNRGKREDPILQPGPADGGRRRHQIGGLRWRNVIRRAGNEIDAAQAWFDATLDYEPTYLGRRLRGVQDDVDLDDYVWKVGRTTNATEGNVTAFGLDISVDYSDAGDGSLMCGFTDQIEIRETGGGVFSRPGDSGSLIIGRGNLAVGLLFSGSVARRVTYANPIQKVLDACGSTLDL